MQFLLNRGRNGFDPPLLIGEDESRETLNMDLYDGQLGRKRGGVSNDTMTFSAGGPFLQEIKSIIRHVPGSDESAMELFTLDESTTVGRKAASTQYAAVTVKDVIYTRPVDVHGISFNGKLFFGGWHSNFVNRAQCWDGSTIRRVGVGTAAAPSVANTGGGAYPAVLRYYRQRYTVQSGGVTLRQGEAGASQSFTPSGAGTAARVTKAASISEGETHWQLEVSLDNADWHILATTAVGTTTYDDSALTSTYAALTSAPLAGTNFPPPAAKCIGQDGNRMLWYGCYESSAGDSVEPKQGRVWFSALLGSAAGSIGDDERVPIQSAAGGIRYYIDIGENDGGEPRGLAGPLMGSMYAFQSNGITELTPTGRVNTPYKRYQLSRAHGAVNQKSIVMAVDASGNPAIYFLSPKDGPRRIGRGGIEWCGADVKDRWDLVNLDATTTVAHGIYYQERNQVWWWIATGANNTPNEVLVFDISSGVSATAKDMPAVRHGWTRFTGNIGSAHCSCLFSTTPGASMARKLKPYIGSSTAINKVQKCDTGTDDAGTNFAASVQTRPYVFGLDKLGAVTGATLTADPASGVSIQLTVTPDCLLANSPTTARTDTVTLTAAGSETVVFRRFEAPELAGLPGVSFTIGDAAAVSNGWTLHGLTVTTKTQERVSP